METTITILTVFTGIVALAFVLQAIALILISRKLRELSTRLDAFRTMFTKQAEALSVLSAQAGNFLSVVSGIADKLQVIQQRVTAVSEVVHKRVMDVDAFFAEATDSARLQIARLQDVVETTSHKIDETIDILQTAVLAPVTELQAIIRAVRTGLDVLFGWRRSSARRSHHHDEEMFI